MVLQMRSNSSTDTDSIQTDSSFVRSESVSVNPYSGSTMIIYIDGQSLTRDSISQCLKHKFKDYEIVPAATVAEAGDMAQNREASLVLMSIGSHEVESRSVMESISYLTGRLPDVPLALLAADDSYESVMSALRLGVRGYIPTSLTSAVVVEAVRLICAGEIYAPLRSILAPRSAEPERQLGARAAAVGFSERQVQILNCLRLGLANKQIAAELSMSEATVKVHVRKIMRRLKAANRTQVVMRTMSLFGET